MKRRAFLLGLAVVTTLAMTGLPAHGQGKSTAKFARVRPTGGVLMAGKLVHGAGSDVVWGSVASMVTPVQEMGGGAGAGSKLYVPGGFLDFTPTLENHMQIYNATANMWTEDPDVFPTGTPGWADAAVCTDPATGKIHVVNGVDGFFLYTAHMVFDPAAPAGSKWSFLNNPNTALDGNYYSQDSGCAFLGGKMYLFSGYGVTDAGCCTSAAVQKITWVYDPATDTWSDTGFLTVTPHLWGAYGQNGTNIVFAGGTDNVTTFAPTNKAEVFNTSTGWAAMGNLPAALLGPGMALLTTGTGLKKVLVMGGLNSSFAPVNTTYGATVGATWSNTMKNLVTARALFGYGVASGKVTIGGGGDSTGASITSAEKLA